MSESKFDISKLMDKPIWQMCGEEFVLLAEFAFSQNSLPARCCFSTENDSHFFDLRDFQKADRQVWAPYMDADALSQTSKFDTREDLKESMSSALTSIFNEGSRRHEDEEIMRRGRHL